ncbi:MAG: hypothetical protein IRY87_34590 [Acetobacteraceae bacterium]|nr:hypothetical protein [Acetobacteraceae bacterium]
MTRGADPILEVTGVPAADILRRCAAQRTDGGTAVPVATVVPVATAPIEMPDLPERDAWRLIDLSEGSNAEFVVAAHLALLGRRPYEREFARRLGELSAGRTRLEVIGRLALSREGRRTPRPPVAGLALPMLVMLARGGDRILRLVMPVLGRASRIWRPIRMRGLERARRIYGATLRIPVLGGLTETLVVLTRLRRLRREVMELRAEIERLKAEVRR